MIPAEKMIALWETDNDMLINRLLIFNIDKQPVAASKIADAVEKLGCFRFATSPFARRPSVRWRLRGSSAAGRAWPICEGSEPRRRGGTHRGRRTVLAVSSDRAVECALGVQIASRPS